MQIHFSNNKGSFMQIIGVKSGSSRGWPRLHFLSGGSKWYRECTDIHSLWKRSRPRCSIKSDTVKHEIPLEQWFRLTVIAVNFVSQQWSHLATILTFTWSCFRCDCLVWYRNNCTVFCRYDMLSTSENL